MGDYEEQQSMELEALESILMDDLQEVTDSIPSGWSVQGTVYRIEIGPQLDDGAAQDDFPVRAELVFAHTPTYPDEAPLAKARSLRGLSDAELASLQAIVDAQVEENMGMPMIYTLITAMQDWVTEQGAAKAAPSIDPEAERKRREAEEEARIAALRAHGTPVTPETFAEWRSRFEAELALAKAAVEDPAAVVAGPRGRLTGRQWFQQQEAQHIEIEEPELGEDEEDAEVDRSEWSGERGGLLEEEDLDDLLESDEDEDEMLDEILAAS